MAQHDAGSRGGPPRSCTGYAVGAVGLCGFAAGLWAATAVDMTSAHRVLVLSVITAAPMIAWAMLVERVFERDCTGLNLHGAGAPDIGRVYTKLLGLAATGGLMAVAYWALPIYREPFYRPFFDLVAATLPWIAGAGVLYVYWLDPRMAEPEDGAWHLGCVVTGRWGAVDAAKVRAHALGWAIKGYFLPIMVGWLGQNLDWLARPGLIAGAHGFLAFLDIGKSGIFTLDLGFATLGYVLTLRIVDGQIRSPEPTLLGWMAALICYPPANDLMFNNYLTWSHDYQWQAWLADRPRLLVMWGSIVIAIEFLFSLATVSFGYRFSNLTHRGILTHGLYRLTKHPAYVTKCVSFWMVAIPFIPAQGWEEAVRQSLALAGVNLIYWLRARTEERHLSRDPTYVEYALWIEEHGIFRWLGGIFPFLRYRPPAEPGRGTATVEKPARIRLA
jgi:protein-S-isoprenylcysteine O-methyltransferase Ste14